MHVILHEKLQGFPYDSSEGVHHIDGILQSEVEYKAAHSGVAFPVSKRLPLWDTTIAKDASSIDVKMAMAIHQAKREDYDIWFAATEGVKASLRNAVEEV